MTTTAVKVSEVPPKPRSFQKTVHHQNLGFHYKWRVWGSRIC